MAYVKQEWKNLPNQTTPVNATRMNHIEQGIYDNSVAISNIIESGSNSNGSWIKYSDGTMICTKQIGTDISTTLWSNGIYYSDYNTGNWAQTFSKLNGVQATSLTNQWWCNVSNSTTSNSGTLRLMRPDNASPVYFSASIVGFGRWK